MTDKYQSRNSERDNLIGESACFLETLEHISQVAPLDKPVLVVGERGTGKELIAARLHYLSSRWDQPFITMNCAAINENLLETDLFGHESGSFTGAGKKHIGRFERADHGTLFLDELANSSSLVQEKLLRVIEYGEYERVGGTKTLKTDVRLICATNEDLPYLAEQGQFRHDLLDRLAFDVITIPPLRARQEDIPMLSEYFALNMTRELKREYFAGFSPRAFSQLSEYSWPGNIRELKNVIERNVYRTNEDEIISSINFNPFTSPWRLTGNINGKENIIKQVDNTNTESEESSISEVSAISTIKFPIDLKTASQDYEISLIKSALKESQFNQKKTAELLELTYHQLRGYLKKYQLLD
ncbi:MAG: phage shock protein operon transcriptional activator [Gammaproteobacteria bacterium]|nr:phage shock protein operon transcriptional activator [Gammaproteobacteria bacterium]